MQSRGNALKLTAVAALVVLSLTGFSTGRGGTGGSGDGGGGGCSSSSQNHDSSSGSGGGSHRDDDYDDSGSAGSGGGSDGGADGSTLRAATVELVACASPRTPYATVEVTNPNTTEGVFAVTVTFLDKAGARVATRLEEIPVPAGDTVTAEVNLADPQQAARITRCDLDPTAAVAP
ncbi:hypothetical protein ACFYOV_20605 [Streptomyces sp. NPDC005931]|uniref:hypothetical protein n=1 Tax=Streptomyces sp. NPDC005931 TaxID=3364737 RepID=UPI00368C209D